MSIVINSPQFVSLYRRDSATSATPLVPSLDPADYAYNNSAFPGGDDVKAALDELLSVTTVGAQFFSTSDTGQNSGVFTVPRGVQELLVLFIGPGQDGMRYTSSPAAYQAPGGLAFSFYAAVVSDQTISVFLRGTASTQGMGYASFGTYANSSLPVPEESRIFSAYAGKGSAAPSKQYGPSFGGGGFRVEHNGSGDPLRRKEWLAVALHHGSPENGPTDGNAIRTGQCWPYDGGLTNSASGQWYGGGGASVTGNQARIGRGGGPFIAIFWGRDIRNASTSHIPPVTLSS